MGVSFSKFQSDLTFASMGFVEIKSFWGVYRVSHMPAYLICFCIKWKFCIKQVNKDIKIKSIQFYFLCNLCILFFFPQIPDY